MLCFACLSIYVFIYVLPLPITKNLSITLLLSGVLTINYQLCLYCSSIVPMLVLLMNPSNLVQDSQTAFIPRVALPWTSWTLSRTCILLPLSDLDLTSIIDLRFIWMSWLTSCLTSSLSCLLVRMGHWLGKP